MIAVFAPGLRCSMNFALDGGVKDVTLIQDAAKRTGVNPVLIEAVLAAYTGWLRWPQPLQPVLFWAGIALMAGGLLLRWISVRTLDRWFTVDVAVRDDQRLIQHGPYRWLRHPSYTGALLSFLGLAAGLGNLVSAGVLLVPVIAAFVVRIRVEEQALAAAFPKTFPAYARQRRRLVPGLW